MYLTDQATWDLKLMVASRHTDDGRLVTDLAGLTTI